MTRTIPIVGILAGCAVAGVALAGGDPLVRATQLPEAAHQLRLDGVPEADVAGALKAARGHGLAAGDATEVLEVGREAEREHGPIDNFGSFVQEQLDSGKRGRELAAAIHAEHAKRGKKAKGKPEGKGGGPPEGKGGGPPEGKGGGPPEGKGGGPPEGKGGGGDKGASKAGGRGKGGK